MKIYIVVDNTPYEGITIKRVFRERKSAEQYLAFMEDDFNSYKYKIEEHEAESFADYVDVNTIAIEVEKILRSRFDGSAQATRCLSEMRFL